MGMIITRKHMFADACKCYIKRKKMANRGNVESCCYCSLIPARRIFPKDKQCDQNAIGSRALALVPSSIARIYKRIDRICSAFVVEKITFAR